MSKEQIKSLGYSIMLYINNPNRSPAHLLILTLDDAVFTSYSFDGHLWGEPVQTHYRKVQKC